jgi:hypothetical protein
MPQRARRRWPTTFPHDRYGARIVLGTDTGVHPGHTFGSGEHVELARWVQLGLSRWMHRRGDIAACPIDGRHGHGHRRDRQACVVHRAGRETRWRTFAIHDVLRAVYLDGAAFDRNAMLAKWRKADTGSR